jgi:hypothetical protein
MLYVLRKPIVMSIPEFMEIERGMKLNKESFTTKIMKNDRFKKFTVVLLASVLYTQKCLAAGKGIDQLGWTLLSLIRQWAYWILIIMCVVDVIKAGAGGDSKKILGIIMKYLLIFASMYLLPTLFDAVKNSF